MSMYAIHESAIDNATGQPVAIPSRPQLRLVGPTASPPRATSRAVFWRRRLAAALVALTVVLAARAVTASPPGGGGGATAPPIQAAASGSPAPVSHSTYVVQRGDTLWAIARALQPQGDVRPTVDRMAALRRGRPLEVGERLALP